MKRVILAVAAVMVSAVAANAIQITPTTQKLWSGTNPGNPDAGDVASITGFAGTLIELYKQDVGAANDVGSYKDSYSTTFANTATDPTDATITYAGAPAPSISGNPLYLLVKDGQGPNIDPWWYIFDLNKLDLARLSDLVQGCLAGGCG